jgi:hypothetical protein
MLWDMIRYENFDETSPYNREAAAWAKHQTYFQLPLDRRPLRDKLARATTADDLIPLATPVTAKPAKSKSSRGSSAGRSRAGNPSPTRAPQQPPSPALPQPAASSDVLFIDGSEPIEAQLAPQPRRSGDGDILFIE